MEQIKDIVKQVIGNISSGKPEIHNKLQRLWQNVLDKKSVKHTAIVGLRKGELVIHVDSPAWLFQMNLQKKKILERIRTEYPELSAIRFKLGKVT